MSGYTLLGVLSDEFSFVHLPDEFELPDDFKLYVGEERKYAVLRDEVERLEVPGIGADIREALGMFGAHIGRAKRAAVLYRVRATFAERERHFSRTTVGYPIAIWQDLA